MRIFNRKKPTPPENQAKTEPRSLSASLQENLDVLKQNMQGCSDAVFKEFKFGNEQIVRGTIIFFDGLVDKNEIELNLLKPLLLELDMQSHDSRGLNNRNIINSIMDTVLTTAELKKVEDFEKLYHHIASGDTVLLVDGCAAALAAGTRSWQGRSIQTPENEVTVFGPKEGFTETLRLNTAMLRRRIKSHRFKMESFVLGSITQTDVVLCYIEGVAPGPLVSEIKDRLSKIEIDGVLDTGYLAEFITDDKYSLFSQTEHTEKPDRVCGQLLEGRAAIIVDGSPMAITLPVSFPQYMISPEDYYVHYIPASLFRLLRLTAFMAALLLPSLYVAVISYHHEMIPTPLLLTIAATRQGVPFPAFVEALLLDLTFELLREAGLRLPRGVGPAVSIVGALIIGDAAVRAGLVSTPMVVVIAATGIASFVSPSYNAAIIIRIARFGFLIAAGLLGFLGIMVGLLLLALRMASLSSFGLPYLYPLAPFDLSSMTDIIVRRPWFKARQQPGKLGINEELFDAARETGGPNK